MTRSTRREAIDRELTLSPVALDLTAGRAGLGTLAEAMRRWIPHLLGVGMTIDALTELRSAPLTWYVGLDAEATWTGDLIWHGREIDEATMAQVAGLFRLTFDNPALALDRVQEEPAYLILAVAPDHLIRMKPQNLVTGLPIRQLEAVG